MTGSLKQGCKNQDHTSGRDSQISRLVNDPTTVSCSATTLIGGPSPAVVGRDDFPEVCGRISGTESSRLYCGVQDQALDIYRICSNAFVESLTLVTNHALRES
jgi:hypothetical protein